jgi:glycosyltransferase involved in cell wall biosynthesis
MIDIIIPVYNTPIDDLKRCLDSVFNQTFKDFKVLIIDDGSQKEIKDFLDEYTKDNDKFIVKHIENKGVSNARNVGIELSNSEYIAFIDSDDTVEPNYLEEAYSLIKDNQLDIIIGGYNEIKDNKIIKTRISSKGLHIYEGDKITNFFEKLLSSKTNDNNKEIGDCPVGRIYTRLFRRDSINNLRFDTNTLMSEDTLFMIDYTYQVKRIGIVDKIWYSYYKNDYSISLGTKKDKMINNINGFIKEIEKRKSKEKNLLIKDAYQKRIEKSNKTIEKINNIN